MTTVYIDDRGVLLCKKNQNILVKKDNGIQKELLPEQIDRIVLNNGCHITSDVLSLILKHSIPTVLMSGKRFAGYLNPANYKNTPLRYYQYDLFKNQEKRLLIYQEILNVKVYNQYRFLKKLVQYRDVDTYTKTLNTIDTMRKGIARKKDVESLLGYEGNIARHFFSIYGQLFPDEFVFEHRSRRPPKDPANAILSFGYTILLGDINNAILKAGLDPNVGMIHTLDYSRPSLSIDIIEEFRFIIESLTLSLFNKGMLKTEHFEENDTYSVYISKEGRTQFFKGYEEKMNTKQTYCGEKKDYRELIALQVSKIKDFIEKDLPYVGYKYNQ